MATLDEVKVALRVTSDAFDGEVGSLVAAAERDMRRVGVPEGLIASDPLAKMATVLYCKANFGYDNSEAARFMQSYRQTVADMLNSPASYAGGGSDAVE